MDASAPQRTAHGLDRPGLITLAGRLGLFLIGLLLVLAGLWVDDRWLWALYVVYAPLVLAMGGRWHLALGHLSFLGLLVLAKEGGIPTQIPAALFVLLLVGVLVGAVLAFLRTPPELR